MAQELMCGHRERFGDVEQAEATFRAAESLDSSWPLTLMSLARYASDRGDAERGLSLVRRAGATAEHELVMLLEVAEWPALIQFIHSGWPAGLLAARRPGHRKLLKTFALQAFLPVGVTEARVERPSPRACAVVQPAQRADVLARG